MLHWALLKIRTPRRATKTVLLVARLYAMLLLLFFFLLFIGELQFYNVLFCVFFIIRDCTSEKFLSSNYLLNANMK